MRALAKKKFYQLSRNPNNRKITENKKRKGNKGGQWQQSGEKAYNNLRKVTGIDPKGLAKEKTYLEMWQKAAKNETFRKVFEEFFPEGDYADHPIELKASKLKKIGRAGVTTHISINDEIKFDKNYKAVIEFNNEFVPKEGAKAGKLSDLALAGTIFHEFWHLKLTKWAAVNNMPSTNDSDHRIMSMTAKGSARKDKKLSFLEEYMKMGAFANYKKISNYAEAKLKFLEEIKGKPLTEAESMYHTWVGLGGDGNNIYSEAMRNVELREKFNEARKKVDSYTGLESGK